MDRNHDHFVDAFRYSMIHNPHMKKLKWYQRLLKFLKEEIKIKRPMANFTKNFIIGIILGALFGLLLSFLYVSFAHASDSLSGQLTVDFPKEEARYTESHSFGVQMSASVAENDCNRCLRDNGGSACLEECSDVLLTY